MLKRIGRKLNNKRIVKYNNKTLHRKNYSLFPKSRRDKYQNHQQWRQTTSSSKNNTIKTIVNCKERKSTKKKKTHHVLVIEIEKIERMRESREQITASRNREQREGENREIYRSYEEGQTTNKEKIETHIMLYVSRFKRIHVPRFKRTNKKKII